MADQALKIERVTKGYQGLRPLRLASLIIMPGERVPADFQAPPPHTYGDSGRGILHAPGHINFDTSLSKRFTLRGRTNLEVRWDAFNLFNHPAFGVPNANIGNASVGRITTTVADNRSMQFALKLNF